MAGSGSSVCPPRSLFSLFFFVFVHCAGVFICDCPGLRAQWPGDPRPQEPQGETLSSRAYSPQWPGQKMINVLYLLKNNSC